MSTHSSLKARLAQRVRVRDAAPPPSYSGEPVPLALRREQALDRPIDIVHRLRAAGLALRAAHAVLTSLTDRGDAVCWVAQDAGIDGLARDLRMLGVSVHRRRPADPAQIAQVRARHGLSQREFADRLGLDTNTLQNWEQGRNRPDPAVLTLIRMYDHFPKAVNDAVFEPIEP